MSALSPQNSRYNPRTFLSFFAGSLTVILVYILVGHLPSRQSLAPLEASSHSDFAPEGSDYADAFSEGSATHTTSIAPSKTEQEDGWYTGADENPYGPEGADVSELLTPEQFAASNENMKKEHIELKSQMTKNGKWFTTDWVTQEAYNPGFLPHPYKPDTWVMFGQRDKSKDEDDIW